MESNKTNTYLAHMFHLPPLIASALQGTMFPRLLCLPGQLSQWEALAEGWLVGEGETCLPLLPVSHGLPSSGHHTCNFSSCSRQSLPLCPCCAELVPVREGGLITPRSPFTSLSRGCNGFLPLSIPGFCHCCLFDASMFPSFV